MSYLLVDDVFMETILFVPILLNHYELTFIGRLQIENQ